MTRLSGRVPRATSRAHERTIIRSISAVVGAAALALSSAPAPGAIVSPRADEPSFEFLVRPLTAGERDAMTPSVWRRGCPVPLRKLRVVQADHWNFARGISEGRLVVHQDVTDDVVSMWAGFFAERFPIRKMIPIQRYGGSDFDSIEADNTSAFNCRPIAGGRRWSQHAYGRAIDINPLENPYVHRGRTVHRDSVPFLDRSDIRRGMLVENSPALRMIDEVGWRWGGRWKRPQPKDYQHISANGH